MNNLTPIVVLLATGILLGSFFFAGLWWTVRRALASRYSLLWLFLSLVVRGTVVLGGFYLFARDTWQHTAVCLLGFIIARTFILRLLRPKSEANHAP